MKNRGQCPSCGVETAYDTEPLCIDCQNPCEVLITGDDKVELCFMLRGRGASGLKTKLLRALTALDLDGQYQVESD